jgi:lipopolysaccharide assembly protein A
MGQVALIVSLVLAAGIAMFAVQNAGPVLVRFGFWSVELSLVVVILVALALGAILASLIGLPGWMRDRRRLRQQSRQLETLQAAQRPAAPSSLPPSSRPSA